MWLGHYDPWVRVGYVTPTEGIELMAKLCLTHTLYFLYYPSMYSTCFIWFEGRGYTLYTTQYTKGSGKLSLKNRQFIKLHSGLWPNTGKQTSYPPPPPLDLSHFDVHRNLPLPRRLKGAICPSYHFAITHWGSYFTSRIFASLVW